MNDLTMGAKTTSSIDACITSNHSLASLWLSAAQLMQEGSALNQLIEINASAGLNRHEIEGSLFRERFRDETID